MTTPTTARPTDGSHLPAFHLNGSGRQALLDQLEAAYRATDAAITALCRSAPHERDYYVLGAGAYDRAWAEYQRRLDALNAVRDDLATDYCELASRA